MHTPLLMQGQLLDDRYLVIQSLESGRYSQTYIAKDVTQPDSPQCKISCFRPVSADYVSLEVAREIFQREVQKLHHLGTQCDRVPYVLSAFEYKKNFYLVEEIIEGRSLADELKVGRLLSETEAIAMATDVLETLAVVHEEGLIHGDINPANLVASISDRANDTPEVIPIDFAGLRRICNPLLPLQPVPLLGTPSYMPIEQTQGSPQPSYDLYALGLTTIQALTGQHPSQMEIDFATGAIAWPSHVTVSSKLADILERMVHLLPEERYQSATEVLADLKSLQPSGAMQLAASVLDRMKKKSLIAVISSIAVVVTAGSFFYLGKHVSRVSSGQSNLTSNPTTVANDSSSTTENRNPDATKQQVSKVLDRQTNKQDRRSLLYSRGIEHSKGTEPKLKSFVRSPSPIPVPTTPSTPSTPSSSTDTTDSSDRANVSPPPVPSKLAVLPALSPRYTLMGHTGSVVAIDFFANGHSFVSGSDDKTLRLWDTRARRALTVMSNHSGYVSSITAVATSPDGHTFASGSLDNTVKIWNFRSGKPAQLLVGHTNRIMSVAFDPSGQYLVSGSGDRTVKLWDLSRGKSVLTLRGHTDVVTTVAVSPDGKLIASAGEDRTIVLWDAIKGTRVRTLRGHQGTVKALAFSSDGRILASGSDDKTVRLWDVASGKLVRTFSGHAQSVTSLAFRADGQLLASGSTDKQIGLWDIKTGAVRILTGHSEAVLAVAFSDKDNTLISGSADKTIIVWK
ncbi:serine/threonine-protein kinase [Pseudanabaena sp. PCC 6802]|uniref:serine/threonine-protein kinase n=1 Tax=Pseudanabaena sp. PCC 6802 TaxID=118173 RepID=UPI0009FFBBE1|nr:serine/threonine-protein kinase [Pseudanabaena sp. PCC 6802]